MNEQPVWDEASSQTFIDFGRYFVPERETQLALLAELAALPAAVTAPVLELGCGEGLLAAAILQRWPAARVVGYDGSAAMRAAAAANLAEFGERFVTAPFDLFASDWRQVDRPVPAIVSSLVIHHLDGPGKAQLFRDLYGMLAPDGRLVIADVIEPVGAAAQAAAAAAWDEAVRARAQALDGNLSAFAYFQREKWNLFRYPDPVDKPSPLRDQLNWLVDAGFVDVDAYWLQAGHAIFGGRRPTTCHAEHSP